MHSRLPARPCPTPSIPSAFFSLGPFVWRSVRSSSLAMRAIAPSGTSLGLSVSLPERPCSHSFGLLPNLNEDALPPERAGDIRDSIEKVADAAHKYLPVSIVDVCRESARVMLAEWLSAARVDGAKGDLGEVIKKIPAENEGLRAAARIINRLHPRGKSSERERHVDRGKDLRGVSSEDAELSVALIGFLLREAGWAA